VTQKAKLTISFMLVRKPLQESLYLLESVIADRSDFAEKLALDPVKLWSQTGGGVEVHDMDRRISSLFLLWWDTIEPPYNEPHLENFVLTTRDWLLEHCREAGYRPPNRLD